MKRSSGSPILLEIVSENRFSGKTYFIQLVPGVVQEGLAAVDGARQGRGVVHGEARKIRLVN